jgi:3-methylfumaryl-CoA hydratase
VEGYPGLVVHAPLTALLLLDAGERWAGRPPETFRYRAVAPLFAGRPLTLAGRAGSDGLELWATTPEGALAMKATLEWAA